MAEDEAREIQEALAANEQRRSPVYLWMSRNRENLLKAFSDRRPDWIAITALLKRRGINDSTGKPPTVKAVRQTWMRMNRALAAGRIRQPRRSVERPRPAPPPPPPPPTVRPVTGPAKETSKPPRLFDPNPWDPKTEE